MVSRAERSPFADWWWTVDRWLLTGLGALMVLGIVLTMAGIHDSWAGGKGKGKGSSSHYFDYNNDADDDDYNSSSHDSDKGSSKGHSKKRDSELSRRFFRRRRVFPNRNHERV